MVARLEGLLYDWYLEGGEVAEDLNEGFFVGAKTFHCFAEEVGLRGEVDGDSLPGDVAW